MSEDITMPKWVFENLKNGLRLASNVLESSKRQTAADRQIEYAGRLAAWVMDGKQGNPPPWIPDKR